jgi:hypothetical protein
MRINISENDSCSHLKMEGLEMSYPINGFHDFHTILANERKIGGVIEAEQIQLRSGETFSFPVFTNIDYTGSTFYSLGFISFDGVRMIVNVNDISSIKAPMHKKVSEIYNPNYREMKISEKVNYLRRLYKADQGAFTRPFVQEATLIIEDIGIENVKNDLNIDFLEVKSNKVVRIA